MRAFTGAVFVSFLIVGLVPAGALGSCDGQAPDAARRSDDGDLVRRAQLPESGFPFLETILRAAYPDGKDPWGRPVSPLAVETAIARIADRIRPGLGGTDVRGAVEAFGRVLFGDLGFAYDPASGNPDNFLPDRVLARRKGNCLGLTVLYLALAERLGVPLRWGYAPSHCFPRFEEGDRCVNAETAENGALTSDERYAREFGLSGDRPYLTTLGRREMIGLYLKSQGAALSRRNDEERALRAYDIAALYYPCLPDIPFNAGVSFLKTGRLDEAVARYRTALSLDPGLAAARDNIGVARARQGRYDEALEEGRRAVSLDPRNASARSNLAATLCACGKTGEGIREYLRVLSDEPGNARALAGLASAHFRRGEVTEAMQWGDRAIAAGGRPDPALLKELDRRRPFLPPADFP